MIMIMIMTSIDSPALHVCEIFVVVFILCSCFVSVIIAFQVPVKIFVADKTTYGKWDEIVIYKYTRIMTNISSIPVAATQGFISGHRT